MRALRRWGTRPSRPHRSRSSEPAAVDRVLHVLEFLRTEGCVLDGAVMCATATAGSVPVMEWLAAHGVTADAAAVACVERGRHVRAEEE